MAPATFRYGTNLGFATLNLQASFASATEGVTYSLDATEFTVGAAQTFTVDMTIDVSQAESDRLIGSLTLTESSGAIPDINIPMTVILAALEDGNIFALSGNVVPDADSNMSLDINPLSSASTSSVYDVTIIHPDDVTILPQTAGATARNAIQESFNVDATTGSISWSSPHMNATGLNNLNLCGFFLVDDFGGGEQAQSFNTAPRKWESQGYSMTSRHRWLANFGVSIGGVNIDTLLIDSVDCSCSIHPMR